MTGMLPLEIDAFHMIKLHGEGADIAYVDVRSPFEIMQNPVEGSVNIPMQMLPTQLANVPKADHLIIVCQSGMRSYHAAQWLRQNGFANAQSLGGGMSSWRRIREAA